MELKRNINYTIIIVIESQRTDNTLKHEITSQYIQSSYSVHCELYGTMLKTLYSYIHLASYYNI